MITGRRGLPEGAPGSSLYHCPCTWISWSRLSLEREAAASSSSPHHHLIITSSSPHSHLIITSSPPHHDLIITSSSPHHHLLITSLERPRALLERPGALRETSGRAESYPSSTPTPVIAESYPSSTLTLVSIPTWPRQYEGRTRIFPRKETHMGGHARASTEEKHVLSPIRGPTAVSVVHR